MVLDLLVAIAVLMFFGFWNGLSDCSNSITTTVSSKALSAGKAVMLAAFGTFLGVFFGESVAQTVGTGIINSTLISAKLVILAVVSGMIWEVITYIKGMPISETQTFIASLIGTGLATGGLNALLAGSILTKVLIPMILSPFIAFYLSMVLIGGLLRLIRKFHYGKVNKHFSKMQIVSSLVFSITNGANSGMKIAGLIFALLVYYNLHAAGTAIPFWVKLLAVLPLSIGTLFGGWRLIGTMGYNLRRIKPWEGVCAEGSSAAVIGVASAFGFPISITQTKSSSIMGVGISVSPFSMRRGVMKKLISTWLLTMPVVIAISFVVYAVFDLFI